MTCGLPAPGGQGKVASGEGRVKIGSKAAKEGHVGSFSVCAVLKTEYEQIGGTWPAVSQTLRSATGSARTH